MAALLYQSDAGTAPASEPALRDGIMSDDHVEGSVDMPDISDAEHRRILAALDTLRSRFETLSGEVNALQLLVASLVGDRTPPTTLIGLLAANPWMLAFIVLALLALGKEVVLAVLQHASP